MPSDVRRSGRSAVPSSKMIASSTFVAEDDHEDEEDSAGPPSFTDEGYIDDEAVEESEDAGASEPGYDSSFVDDGESVKSDDEVPTTGNLKPVVAAPRVADNYEPDIRLTPEVTANAKEDDASSDGGHSAHSDGAQSDHEDGEDDDDGGVIEPASVFFSRFGGAKIKAGVATLRKNDGIFNWATRPSTRMPMAHTRKFTSTRLPTTFKDTLICRPRLKGDQPRFRLHVWRWTDESVSRGTLYASHGVHGVDKGDSSGLMVRSERQQLVHCVTPGLVRVSFLGPDGAYDMGAAAVKRGIVLAPFEGESYRLFACLNLVGGYLEGSFKYPLHEDGGIIFATKTIGRDVPVIDGRGKDVPFGQLTMAQLQDKKKWPRFHGELDRDAVASVVYTTTRWKDRDNDYCISFNIELVVVHASSVDAASAVARRFIIANAKTGGNGAGAPAHGSSFIKERSVSPALPVASTSADNKGKGFRRPRLREVDDAVDQMHGAPNNVMLLSSQQALNSELGFGHLSLCVRVTPGKIPLPEGTDVAVCRDSHASTA
ncbi:hypothetical protein BD626DRAFT_543459 [Schizophyllum amplum]|uniref:Uncharacterized protein n=1 Tax=Schizophyllum amplum TaxID=97359 RepID=A0A550BRR1_9AGAR|nr:hypothetical protein BD626DRAFT_543459 [Auriculariopsis ampla]